jgi:hypothetical protein
MSGHIATHSYLNRLQIIESYLCVWLENYETIDHLILGLPEVLNWKSANNISNTKLWTTFAVPRETRRWSKKYVHSSRNVTLQFNLYISPPWWWWKETRGDRDSVWIKDGLVNTYFSRVWLSQSWASQCSPSLGIFARGEVVMSSFSVLCGVFSTVWCCPSSFYLKSSHHHQPAANVISKYFTYCTEWQSCICKEKKNWDFF